MKVGIIGNYGHDNNGDEAILQGIITQLTDHLLIPRQNITIFSNNPANTEARYNMKAAYLLYKKGSFLQSVVETMRRSRSIMKDLDVVIIGGGGILMDMYKRDAPLYSTHAMLAKMSGCKVIIYGTGAGPIQTKQGTFLIKTMLRVAQSVSVRDQESKQLLESIGVTKNIDVIADPAFQLGENISKQPSKKIKNIGVTAVPYFSEQYWPVSDEAVYTQYVTQFAKNLDILIRSHDVNITFFSTKFPQDITVTEDIHSAMAEKQAVTILKDNLYPNTLAKICEEQDIIIGTRLHSLILSVAAKTPVIGIGYHEKVHNFMKKINKESFFVHIKNLENENMLRDLISKYVSNWDKEQESYTAISSEQLLEARKGIQQIQQVIGQVK
ncbi:polysaccharide pyruvyl transferase [Bacillus sp. HMF5848]|uniref:polysaccharide pyruvyl transferase family protein n=1 Tax=Bacillus sp. HMF5848 TaxID=2495421 RepID=UPI000F7AA72E|nr:polysaccharide pyruvyl transferase family protein [Bacillus sp. HMF5848]RSK28724.1 polysaccharide pyruvyl transferase [Bacillus sp. HMF5848]